MPENRASANNPGLASEKTLSRRTLLTVFPASCAALALPTGAAAQIDPAILDVIRELEDPQGWEPSSVVAAKAFAAFRMRQALGLDLPDLKYPRMHLDFQCRAFDDYRRSVWYERDQADGKVLSAPQPSTSLDKMNG